MEADILVDGYNVIKNNPMFQVLEMRNLAEARNLLVRQLKNRYRYTTHRVIVVFDGNDKKEHTSHDDHIRIIFSRYDETADSVIARLAVEAHKAGRKIEMYSDDTEVQHNVAKQGGNTHTTNQLVRQFNATPRDIACRSIHRQAIRRLYGIDPMYKDETEYHPSPGKKKKKPAHRYKSNPYK
jgi:predicted RNA-binding protein with PIN domain